MWHASWQDDESITRSNRTFLTCLSRFITHGGRFDWTGIGVLIEQFGQVSGHSYTQRHVLRLLAWAAARQLIRHVRHPAPGRAAVYEAVIENHPGYRPVSVRRRGLRPRRLLALWHREELDTDGGAVGVQEAAQRPTRPATGEDHHHRSTGPAGA